ncbi:sulfatase-like hydrolase/transferase [Tenacibaculum agarivorans]|uniref:sulfatase-like hydrolase/transferase n=1 Tax=Tenacibaculum agarivorans TaxID=1908389 RepID=UPI00094BA99A|nr:sulfatase-like hydrolase/transferase [Tenacibaculum agarivorans]
MKKLILYIFAITCLTKIYSQQTPSPNIIFIIADDMGWSQTSSNETSMNNPSDFYETPNIALLANEGIAFPNAYVNGANCAPTRAAILSGQWASRTTNNVFAVGDLNGGGDTTLLVAPNQGILTNGEDEIPSNSITIAETLKTAGYTTAHFGKYHVGGSITGNDPTDQGFDYNYGGNFSGTPGSYFAVQRNNGIWRFGARIGIELDAYADPYTANESLELAGDTSLDGTPKHVTDAMVEAAFDFMNTNSNSPFFMHFSNYAIHSPWGQANARADLYAKYAAKPTSQMGHDNVGQAAILEGMDQAIGRIINYLNTTPDPRNPGHMLSANTLVYFTSDNGGANGPEDNQPLTGMKGEYKEGGIRATCFLWSQGLLANMGAVNNTPIQAFDMYPTFADMAGATLPSNYDIDGESLWPILNGTDTSLNRESIFWHFPGYAINAQREQRPASIIRKGQYKLTYFYENESYELYDLDNDISENTNLLEGSPDNSILTVANDLSTDLRNYLIDISAPLPTFRSNGQTVDLPEIIETDSSGGGNNNCTTLTVNSEDFETGWGIWNNGGSDSRRNISDAPYANSGNYCIRLRDNTDTSVTTTNAINASNYESITVAFSYYCVSMDNANEDFWLQISTDGGASFTTVEEWNFTDEFDNDTRYNDQVTVTGPFSSDTRIRFRADASGNGDRVYLDDVVITACENISSRSIVENSTEESIVTDIETIQNNLITIFPNPFENTIEFKFQNTYKIINITLYNILGQKVYSNTFKESDNVNIYDLQLDKGKYFAEIITDGKRTIKQLLKK